MSAPLPAPTLSRSTPPTPEPWLALLRGGAVPALGLTVPVSLGFGLTSGVAAAGSVVFGAVLAIVGLAVGPLLLRLGRAWSPTALMMLAVCGYGAVVLGLALVFLLVSEASWLDGGAGAVGLVAAVGAWLAGQTRSTARLRVLLYGDGDLGAGPHPEV
jgi:ATP synthase protein I